MLLYDAGCSQRVASGVGVHLAPVVVVAVVVVAVLCLQRLRSYWNLGQKVGQFSARLRWAAECRGVTAAFCTGRLCTAARDSLYSIFMSASLTGAQCINL